MALIDKEKHSHKSGYQGIDHSQRCIPKFSSEKRNQMPLQLRGLRTFCLAAQHLSFKKTADELCLTASAVSHQISDLESELGVKLFMRLTRSIELSDKGMQLYEEVAPYLQAIDDAAIKLKKMEDMEGDKAEAKLKEIVFFLVNRIYNITLLQCMTELNHHVFV